MTPVCRDTQKGDVSHLKALSWDKYKTLAPADIVAIVYPKFSAGSQTEVYALSKLQAFEKLIINAFNYNVMGQAGFQMMSEIINRVSVYEVHYSDLHEVDEFLKQDVLEG